MKKLFASILAFGLILLGLVTLTAVPAQAGEPTTIKICHADSGIKAFTENVVSKNSLIKGTGHGGHEGDIAPPFTYQETKDGPVKTFPGLNWEAETEKIYLNGCKIPVVEPEIKTVTPIAPKFTQATCLYPQGVVTLQDQPEGVNHVFGPKLNTGAFGSTWTVSYAPAEGYKFPNGIDSGTFTFEVVPPGPNDPNWDSETNSCGIANTGLSDIHPMILTIGGAAIVGGALFFIVPALMRRRQTA